MARARGWPVPSATGFVSCSPASALDQPSLKTRQVTVRAAPSSCRHLLHHPLAAARRHAVSILWQLCGVIAAAITSAWDCHPITFCRATLACTQQLQQGQLQANTHWGLRVSRTSGPPDNSSVLGPVEKHTHVLEVCMVWGLSSRHATGTAWGGRIPAVYASHQHMPRHPNQPGPLLTTTEPCLLHLVHVTLLSCSLPAGLLPWGAGCQQ